MTDPKPGHRHQGPRESRPNPVKRRAILHLLQTCHRGAAQAITFSKLAEAVRLSERSCREHVESIRRERDSRHRVGTLPSPPYGVFIVETRAEWETVSQVLWSRVGQQSETAKAFDDACRDWFDPVKAVQQAIGFEEVG